jgi:hypothetical protein
MEQYIDIANITNLINLGHNAKNSFPNLHIKQRLIKKYKNNSHSSPSKSLLLSDEENLDNKNTSKNTNEFTNSNTNTNTNKDSDKKIISKISQLENLKNKIFILINSYEYQNKNKENDKEYENENDNDNDNETNTNKENKNEKINTNIDKYLNYISTSIISYDVQTEKILEKKINKKEIFEENFIKISVINEQIYCIIGNKILNFDTKNLEILREWDIGEKLYNFCLFDTSSILKMNLDIFYVNENNELKFFGKCFLFEVKQTTLYKEQNVIEKIYYDDGLLMWSSDFTIKIFDLKNKQMILRKTYDDVKEEFLRNYLKEYNYEKEFFDYIGFNKSKKNNNTEFNTDININNDNDNSKSNFIKITELSFNFLYLFYLFFLYINLKQIN